MSRIKEAFAKGKAFIPFITCGDPDLETTEAVVMAAIENGADLVELGIPFSDPTAEGPVIQAANLRALTGGVTTAQIFGLVRRLREKTDVPLVFMTYANVVFSRGAESFIRSCSEAGVDGLILPDLPFEEKTEFLPFCRKYGVDLISLIAPTSANRIAMIAKEAEGFIYLVSSLGVTGPCAIGFGISTPDMAARMAQEADGVIVGSAIIKILAARGREAAPCVGSFVKDMKDAIC